MERKRKSGKVGWSNLPKDLLIMVAKRLDSRTEILRLRAVCSSWRSSLPPLKNSSLFSVKFPFPISHNDALNPKRRGYFTLSERTIHYLEPCLKNPKPKGWMVKVEQSERGKMRILDPLSRFKFPNSLKVSPKIVDLLNLRLYEVSKVCDLKFIGNNLDMKFNELESISVEKVVMSSVPDWMEDISSADAILTIHSGGKLGYFKLGDKTWSTIDDGQEKSHYHDIAYHNGKFYAADFKGRVIVIDASLNVDVIQPPVPHWGHRHKYLVECGMDLYLVDKYCDGDQDKEIYYDKKTDRYRSLETGYYSDCAIHFRVYKLNDEDKVWVRMNSLGDQTLFIGYDWCYSVSASACKKNSIYFQDGELFEDNFGHPSNNVGIFDLENYTSRYLSSSKGYSQIFWPPPAWLKPKKSPKASSSGR